MCETSRMLKQAVVFGVVLAFSVSVRADYVADRKAATDLVNAGKQAEAMAAFTKMAEAATVDSQKTDALEQAAMCANRLKKYDEAMNLAKKIPQPEMAKAVQMRIMLENGKHEELIAAFKDEQFDKWPDAAAGIASFCRGRAYMVVRDGKAATEDFDKALKTLGEGTVRDEASLLLGDTLRNLNNDDERALAVYTEGIEKAQDKWGWIRLTCITSAAGILAKQKKCDEALAVLGKVDAKTLSAVWKYNFTLAYADVSAAQGKKDEAIAKLNEGLAGKDIADWQKTAFQQKLKELQDAGTK